MKKDRQDEIKALKVEAKEKDDLLLTMARMLGLIE